MSTSRTREKADGELFKSTGIDDNATSTAITIDASENVGIGVTPNAGWSANNKVLDFGYHGSVSTDGDGSKFGMNMAMNAYAVGGADPSSWKYKTNSAFYASLYHQTAGSHNFYVTNNTAATDAAISWTTGFEVLADGKARAKNGLLFGTDTAAANALDDYEEGTWNPVVSGASIAASQILGTYTKIGNRVLFQCYIYGNITSDGTTTAKITGLPFTTGANGLNQAVFYISHNTGVDGESIGGFMPNNNTELIFLNRNPNNVAASWINGSGKEVMVNGTYLTDS